MPKAYPSDSQAKKDRVMKERMDAWKAGEMHPGTGKKGERKAALSTGKRDYKQAIAIALSESGQSRKGKRSSKRTSSRR
jgi:hypothetical protein